MQIVSNGDNLHEMSNLFPGKNKKIIWKCHLLQFLYPECKVLICFLLIVNIVLPRVRYQDQGPMVKVASLTLPKKKKNKSLPAR